MNLDYNKNINTLEINLQQSYEKNSKLLENLEILSNNYLNLETEFNKLKSINSNLLSKEKENVYLKNQLSKKEEEILNLKKEINTLKNDYEKLKTKLDIQYEKDVNQVKYFNENNLYKIENSSKIEKLNDLLYLKNLKLEKNLNNFEEIEKEKIKRVQIEYEKKINNLQKEIKEIKNKTKISEDDKIKIKKMFKLKLKLIENESLLNELEIKSNQIEFLLQQREFRDKIFLNLKNEINIHKKLEKDLIKKNQKFTFLLNKFEKNVDSNEKKENEKKIFSNKLLNKSDDFTNKIIDYNKKFKKNNSNIFYNYEIYKSKYENLKSKLENIHLKYSNLLNHFDEFLESIYPFKSTADFNEKNNNFFINLENFKNCDFEKLDKFEKYSILIIIINYLIPLVYNNINNTNLLKNLNIRYIKDENKQSLLFKNKTNFNKTFFIDKNYLNKKTKNNFLNNLILKDKEKTFSLKKNYSILNLK